ncbi:secreted RxLR effector protein 161-like [Manihot esculenta]|uniref:Uncharacterized protein n=1 Tax=Manihot esculenta TaxID=3983 RepID=A0ACB7HFJ5_MANES|nr:secreted RxLR effector protein 161-like [Manihot esculenta]KAG8650754.1 hypothetical protein MANES_07G071826v8 [Manihot esculenta]
MTNCKPLATPMTQNEKLTKDDNRERANETTFRSLLGSLIYLTNTKPDIVHTMSIVSRYMSQPSKAYFTAAKRILHYIKETKSYGIFYKSEEASNLISYIDSYWTESIDDKKSTSGYAFFLGIKIISWSSRKQKTMALSSVGAEYIATTSAVY